MQGSFMKSHKTQVTTNAVAQPNLTDRLDRESSARRRADIIKRLAELGALLESMGLANLLGNVIPRPHIDDTSKVTSQEDKPANVELGDDFFTNALASFMSASPQEFEAESPQGIPPG
jgi:hypothetical protein